jgi:hypothetical protein
LLTGSGNGTIDNMGYRDTKAIADDMRSTLNTVLGQLARIDSKLDSKPDQGWIINVVCIILGVVLAAIAATTGLFALIK